MAANGSSLVNDVESSPQPLAAPKKTASSRVAQLGAKIKSVATTDYRSKIAPLQKRPAPALPRSAAQSSERTHELNAYATSKAKGEVNYISSQNIQNPLKRASIYFLFCWETSLIASHLDALTLFTWLQPTAFLNLVGSIGKASFLWIVFPKLPNRLPRISSGYNAVVITRNAHVAFILKKARQSLLWLESEAGSRTARFL